MGKHIGAGRRSRTPARVVLSSMVAIAVLLVPAACGDTKDASLCTAFAEWVEARAVINAIDGTQPVAADEIEAVEDYLASVHRLRQVGEGRYAQQLEDLELAVTDALLTLQSIPADADYSTWAPLMEDDIETATIAADQVDKAIRPSCAAALGESGTSET